MDVQDQATGKKNERTRGASVKKKIVAASKMVRSDHMEFHKRLYQAFDSQSNQKVSPRVIRQKLHSLGLTEKDPRLSGFYRKVDELEVVTEENIKDTIGDSGLLLERALSGRLVVPDFCGFTSAIEEIFHASKSNKSGHVADYIPQLARVAPEKFGVSICTIDGQMFSIGDTHEYFSIQSTCKPINYCLALQELGEDFVHRYVGREPSGHSFNEITLDAQRRPHNPMINAGAIMCASMIQRGLNPAEKFDFVLQSWRKLAGGLKPNFDNAVYLSEKSTADRNFALAYFMRENGGFPEESDMLGALDFYFQCCSIEMTAEAMSVVAATLAKSGVCPTTGDQVLRPEVVKDCLSLMHSCGMYDFSGEFAFSIGLPAKSGVGGGLMLVIPNVMGICIWSPPLDELGNTVRGIDFCKRLTEKYSFHKYDGLVNKANKKVDPLQRPYQSKIEGVMALCWAASRGDIQAIQELIVADINLNDADYDGRTAMHLAASEGHDKAVRFLLARGAKPAPKDRWGGTPLDDAEREGHEALASYLRNLDQDLESKGAPRH